MAYHGAAQLQAVHLWRPRRAKVPLGIYRYLEYHVYVYIYIYICNFKLALVPDTSKSLTLFKGLGYLGKCNVLGHLEWHCFFGIKWALIMQW